jgi:hypothetical protein
MELEQWKDIWKSDIPAAPTESGDQLKRLLEAKSSSPVAKMKRNLNIELWLLIIGYGLMIGYYFVAFDGRMNEISWFMLLVAAGFITYYWRKRRLLMEMECLSCEVRSNLERQVRSLEKYIRFYIIAGTALVPLSLLFFGWLFSAKARYLNPDSLFFPSASTSLWIAALAWIGLTVVLTTAIYFLNKWYVRTLYGRHVGKLRKLLDDMDREG